MTNVCMKTQGLLFLVCLLIPVLGQRNDEEVIDLEDLLLNVQFTLKTVKQDQDEIRKSLDARFDRLEKNVQAFKEGVGELKTGLTDRLDKFELKVDEKMGHCECENLTVLLLFFTDQVNARLNKSGLQISTPVEPKSQDTLEPILPRDCADVYDQESQHSGVYTIQPRGSKPFQVYCDMTTDGGGWTVFQRRGNFSGVKINDFYRDWQEYKDGFGDLKAEFWIGLSNISIMTRAENGDQELRIDLADMDGHKRYAKYKKFTVQDEKELFRLSIGNYSGDAGNSLSYHNLQMFSTHDRDNDEFSGNCASIHQGGWWYRLCAQSCLNGLNKRGPSKNHDDLGIYWEGWVGKFFFLAQTEMKFRPMDWAQRNK